MHECILIRHARIHQHLEAVTVPSVEPIAVLVQVTLQELYIHAVEHTKQLPLGVADNYMHPWQDLAYHASQYHLSVTCDVRNVSTAIGCDTPYNNDSWTLLELIICKNTKNKR